MVGAGKKQRHSSGKFGFSHLLRNFHIGIGELPITVWLEDTEYIADNLLLPVDKFKILSGPCALGVCQTLNKAYGIVGGIFAVNRILRLKIGGDILFQFAYNCRLLSAGMRKGTSILEVPLINLSRIYAFEFLTACFKISTSNLAD